MDSWCASSRHRSCFRTLPFPRGKALGEGLQWASQGKHSPMVLLGFMARGWEHPDTAMGSSGCFSVCRGEGWAPNQAHSAPAARVQHSSPSGNEELEGQPWGWASLTSPGGAQGRFWEHTGAPHLRGPQQHSQCPGVPVGIFQPISCKMH